MVLFFLFLFLVPAADQAFKLWVKNNICRSCSLDTAIPFLKITYIKNSGAAFGVLRNGRYFFIGISAIIIFTLLYLLFVKKIKDKTFILGSSFVIGGGIGNLIDRLIYGKVIDYLKVSFFPPVCNISDYFIFMGIILLSFYILKSSKN